MGASSLLPKRLKDIADEEGVSLGYLRKLSSSLEKAGFIKSIKGPGGGFALARDARDIRLREIVNTLSKSKVRNCLKNNASCRRSGNCSVKLLLEEVYSSAGKVLENKTLYTLIGK